MIDGFPPFIYLFICYVHVSKESIYTSKVKYILKKGKPYLWVNEKDMHNVVRFSLRLWVCHVVSISVCSCFNAYKLS